MSLGEVSGPPACSLPPCSCDRCSICHIELLQGLPNGSCGGEPSEGRGKEIRERLPQVGLCQVKAHEEEML